MHAKIVTFAALFVAFLLSLALCESPDRGIPEEFLGTIFIYRENDPGRFAAMRDQIMNRRRISGDRYLELTRAFTLEEFLKAFRELAPDQGLTITGWEETSLGWKLGLRGTVDGKAAEGHLRFLLTASPCFAPELGEGYTAVHIAEFVLGHKDLASTLPGLYEKAFLRFVETR